MQYDEVRNCTWMTLLEGGITELPVDLNQICRYEHITLVRYGSAAEVFPLVFPNNEQEMTDGISFSLLGKDYILYDDLKPVVRQRYTIAHEIGHCLLGHFELYQSKNEYDSKTLELCADRFAIGLLAPSCVLWGCGVQTEKEIQKLCGISLQAAQIRLQHLRMLKVKEEERKSQGLAGCFLLSPLEQEVYRTFQPFIHRYRQEKE